MKAIKLKKIGVDDIYVSVLKARRVTDEEGRTFTRAYEKEPRPTGSLVMDIVAKALAEDSRVTLHDIAAAMGEDPRLLHAAFILVTGAMPRDFFNAYRLRQAREWLERTDLPIKEIARRSGFTSHGIMTRFFATAMKCTPKEYRRLRRPKEFRLLYEW